MVIAVVLGKEVRVLRKSTYIPHWNTAVSSLVQLPSVFQREETFGFRLFPTDTIEMHQTPRDKAVRCPDMSKDKK